MRLPRMRGDRPDLPDHLGILGEFTPHARGSTHTGLVMDPALKVYPACAGIDPTPGTSTESLWCLPRMRGDRPMFPYCSSTLFRFTPHARGSTFHSFLTVQFAQVYPACAGIDPIFWKSYSPP